MKPTLEQLRGVGPALFQVIGEVEGVVFATGLSDHAKVARLKDYLGVTMTIEEKKDVRDGQNQQAT